MSVITTIHALDYEKSDKEIEEFFEIVKSKKIDDKNLQNFFKELKDDIEKYPDAIFSTILNHYLETKSVTRCINSSLGEDQHTAQLEVISNYFSLDEIDLGIPSKEGFIELLSKLNKENIREISKKFASQEDLEYSEGEWYILDTLDRIIPLAKELRDNKNSVLIVSHDYDFPWVLPGKENKMIKEKINSFIHRIQIDSELGLNTKTFYISPEDKVKEKVFYKLDIISKSTSGSDLFLSLHNKEELNDSGEPLIYASKISPGQDLNSSIKYELETNLGVSDFEIKDIIYKGFDLDKNGQKIPLFLVVIKIPFLNVRGKKINDNYLSWVSSEELKDRLT